MQEIGPSDESDVYSARLAGTDVISCLVLSCMVFGRLEVHMLHAVPVPQILNDHLSPAHPLLEQPVED